GAVWGLGLVQLPNVKLLEQVRLEPGRVVRAPEYLRFGRVLIGIGPVGIEPRPPPERRRTDARLLDAAGAQPRHGVVYVGRQVKVDPVDDALNARLKRRPDGVRVAFGVGRVSHRVGEHVGRGALLVGGGRPAGLDRRAGLAQIGRASCRDSAWRPLTAVPTEHSSAPRVATLYPC